MFIFPTRLLHEWLQTLVTHIGSEHESLTVTLNYSTIHLRLSVRGDVLVPTLPQ